MLYLQIWCLLSVVQQERITLLISCLVPLSKLMACQGQLPRFPTRSIKLESHHYLTCNSYCRPFLLQAKASYTQIGIFSLASYPYSFKLFWSPIVDSIYSLAFGRRKSWIVSPLCMFQASIIMRFLSHHAKVA